MSGYPQQMFLLKKKKNMNNFWLKKAPYLELCNVHAGFDEGFYFLLVKVLDIVQYFDRQQRV